ncbi:MAG: peptidylprolyl isomerase, partial [Alphaproteobacteria bacterium]|nr:peptidylprolyl isomerase [Alphaproteobacteria bacterium]
MTKHHFPLAILLAPVALCAQTPVTSPAPPPAPTAPPLASTSPAPVLIHVVLNTSLGPIELALDKTHAPISTANFLHYLDLKKLDGTNFYRALKVTPNDGLVQFGVKYPLKPIAHEPTSQTGLTNKDGAIAMARQAPGTAAGDFFIDVGDMSGLDAKPGGSGDTAGYAVFG